MTTETELKTRIEGEWQTPRNLWQGAPNSIHSDAVAKKIGMRGGTIPGTVHLTHFPAIMTRLFGDRWLKRGSISMYYTFATLDGEKVRAIVEAPPPGAADDVQLSAWVENGEGKTVAKGTVAVGKPDAVAYVRSLPLEEREAGEVRILAGLKVGMATPERLDYRITKGGVDGEIRDFGEMFRALNTFPQEVDTAPAVGFFGATEIVLHDGPLKLGASYRKTGKVAGFGATPKTEYAWIDSALHDQDGKLIAEMRHMTRWMKVSSPKWAS
jgi:hypothetical protein